MQLPAADAGYQHSLEARINQLWQACGCNEGAVATIGFIAVWVITSPLRGIADIGLVESILVFALGLIVVAAAVKVTAIVVAHHRLARLLEQEARSLGLLPAPEGHKSRL